MTGPPMDLNCYLSIMIVFKASIIHYVLFLLRLILCARTVTLMSSYGGNYDQNYDFSNFKEDDLFEGDIMLTSAQKEAIMSGISSYSALEGGKWPNGIVPYVITPATPYEKEEMDAITDAMQMFADHTCIRFVKRRNEDLHYIRIRKYRRRDGKEQEMRCKIDCETCKEIIDEEIKINCEEEHKCDQCRRCTSSIGRVTEERVIRREGQVLVLSERCFKPNGKKDIGT